MSLLLETPLFNPPISTSNLVEPPRDLVVAYAKRAFNGEPIVAELEAKLAAFHQVDHCIAVCNGFWSLVLAISTLALPDRTDVLMPSFTYRRMADVVAWTKLRPRFCEVDQTTLACSAHTMRAALHPDVALLLPVHPIVGLCDVAGMIDLSRETGLPLVFDSVEAAFEHTPLGRIGGFGDAECFSLHASKLINGLEGGYITTKHAETARRLRAVRDGTAPDGMDVRLSALHAAMALAGLDEVEDQVARNRERYLAYARLLAPISGLRLLPFAQSAPTSFKTIVVELTRDWPVSRAETLAKLNANGALARAYYHPPLHTKPMAYPHVPATLPVTDDLGERFMLLPCGHHVGLDHIEAVAELLTRIAQ